MSEITDEMLRRFMELGGWTPHVVDRESTGPLIVYWHPPTCGKDPKHGSKSCDYERHRESMRDFRTDLAACFEVLERVCEERGLLWTVGKSAYTDDSERFFCVLDPNVTLGPTKQDAIILAVLAAGGKDEHTVID